MKSISLFTEVKTKTKVIVNNLMEHNQMGVNSVELSQKEDDDCNENSGENSGELCTCIIKSTDEKDKCENRFSRITQRIDNNRIRPNFVQFQPKDLILSSIDHIKNINWDKVRPQRGGVIPYTIKDGEVYFGLGVDTKTGDITDLGGGIRYKKDGDAVTGSLREFMEESLCVFGAYTPDNVKNNVVVYTNSMMIIFVHFDVNMEQINEIFDSRVKTSKYSEISSLIWIPKTVFLNCIKTGWLTTHFCNRRLYFRVRKLLQTCIGCFSYL